MIIKHVPEDSDTVWDICCDHGKVGRSFLPLRKVVFIDQVAYITKRLSGHLEKEFLASEQASFEVLTANAREVDYMSLGSNCYVVTGVGGELGMEIISQIFLSMKPEDSILVCVHKNTHKLRCFLSDLGLGLCEEVLIKENNQFYELVLVNKTSTLDISPVGSLMWQSPTDDHSEYLKSQKAYYMKKSKYKSCFLDVFKMYDEIL